jgi:hypothetical protein
MQGTMSPLSASRAVLTVSATFTREFMVLAAIAIWAP